MLKNLKYILIPISILFFALNFIHYNIIEDKQVLIIREKYNPSLNRLNTLDKLESYVDSMANVKNITTGTLTYAVLARNVVSKRFYHKYATQDLNENWIASVTQKITGLYLSSKITADDILKKPYGYCGQQCAVLMELLMKKNIPVRALYLPHHFVIQAYINEQWCFFDVDKEPDVLEEQRFNKDWLFNQDSLAIAYKTDLQTIAYNFGSPVNIRYGKINEEQGKNAQLFQSITSVLSKIAFIFPLGLFFYLEKKNKKKQKNLNQE
ncbi:MAG TPA: hypothetical protein PK987_06475 [Ferruginibacter sp.]|nr:hypothetical protein [Ferruginibacter sp.]